MPTRTAHARSALVAAVALAAGMVLAGAGLTVHAEPPPPAEHQSNEDAARAYFSDLPLVTQEGKEVRFYTDVLRDRVVVLNSFYTHCAGVSPRQNQVLSQLQDLLGDKLGQDVFIVSITVDPKRDTVETIREYAEEYGARPGWIFLTGEPANVDRINRKLGQYLDDLEEHKGVYALGNVKTALWMKVPFHAMASDLYFQIRRLLEDQVEAPDA